MSAPVRVWAAYPVMSKVGRRPRALAEFLAGRRGWRCAFCGGTFPSEVQLMRHTRELHDGEARLSR